jgi:uncharacterized protein involved in tolerance to divalent cations
MGFYWLRNIHNSDEQMLMPLKAKRRKSDSLIEVLSTHKRYNTQ